MNIGSFELMSKEVLEDKAKKEINRIHSEQLTKMLIENDYVFTTIPEIKHGELTFQTLKSNCLDVLKELISYNKLVGSIYSYNLNRTKIIEIKQIK